MAKLLILKGIPEDKRFDFWLLISGAKREMEDNPNYYDNLLYSYPKDIDLQHYHQIELVGLDLYRI
jgi:hypothetical protein